ncbi:Gfo/Idh/MocA family protein [Paenibacillus kribbensis]|uniref:Gfo/Idh/MocA family protein n=1 Tax=Paenibacillus kribbensis TaxID=172713 RepID=UPI0015BE5A6E|nr:Gfo/Idh/MocA family oxidoreductase [Paenibacillus kribbensis]
MKLGMIGTGWISQEWVKAVKEAGEWEITALFVRNRDKGEAFAATCQLDNITLYDSLEEMAKSDIDAIYIATPNSLHISQARLFLEHGKHAIVEKPISLTEQELRDAYELADQNGCYLLEAVRHIHEPNFLRLKDNVKRVGSIQGGSLYSMQFSSRYDQLLSGDVPNIFSLSYGGGALMDLGVYSLYFAIDLLGAPTSGVYRAKKHENGVDLGGPILLSYPDFTLVIQLGKNAVTTNRVEIYGDQATLISSGVSGITEVSVLDVRTKVTDTVSTPETHHFMFHEAREFYRIITEQDQARYEELKSLSIEVQKISNELRHQNGIYFEDEQK